MEETVGDPLMSVLFAVLLTTMAAPPEAKAMYYLGESQVTTADGRPIGNLVALVKREQFPSESKIVETVLMISSKPREPSQEYVGIFTVTGSSFTLKEQRGAFVGAGELTGSPWEWTAWTTTTRSPGGVLKSQTRVTDRGLSVTKELLGPDGRPRIKYLEDYAAIDGGTYELFHAKLFPKSAR